MTAPGGSRWLRRLVIGGLVVAGVGTAAAYGYLVSRNELPPHELVDRIYALWTAQQRDRGLGAFARAAEGTDAAVEAAEILRGLGYVGGVNAGPTGEGVAFHSPEHAYPGWNLYTSGHAPEAYLLDMDGNVVHSWRVTFDQAFPDHNRPDRGRQHYWRVVRYLAEGELLVIFGGEGIMRVSRDSDVIWSSLNRAHHDMEIGPDGRLYVLTMKIQQRPDFAEGAWITDDYVSILDEEGRELQSISLLDSLLRSPFAKLVHEAAERARSGHSDIFHTNDLDVLPAGTELPAGVVRTDPTVLLSWHRLDTIALLNLRTETIDWVHSGVVKRQHDPTLLPGGNLIVFDNGLSNRGSRVVEFDPGSQTVAWKYPAEDLPELYSDCCGNAYRLPNGNTLTVFTGPARALEVTPGGDIAWEFRNPHRTDDGQFVGQLMQMQRLPLDTPMDWAYGFER